MVFLNSKYRDRARVGLYATKSRQKNFVNTKPGPNPTHFYPKSKYLNPKPGPNPTHFDPKSKSEPEPNQNEKNQSIF